MNKRLNNTLKIIQIVIIFIFFINSSMISNAQRYVNKIEIMNLSFVTLYVGGFGEGNYSSINEAINNSNNGDIIYVYEDSSPYIETITIDKSIFLFGENKTTTIIDGNNKNSVIIIRADNVHIKGFTIQNCEEGLHNAGLKLENVKDVNVSGNIIKNNIGHGIFITDLTYSTIIYNNIIFNNDYGLCIKDSINNIIICNEIVNNINGLYLINSTNNLINKNNFTNKWTGIHFEYSNSNNISNNNFLKNADGVYFYKSSNNSIFQNNINDNFWFGIWLSNSFKNLIKYNIVCKNDDIGIYLDESDYNIISENFLLKNDDGIYIEYSFNNIINKNFFQNIKLNGYFVANSINQCFNSWNENYWDHPRFIPFPILGKIKLDKIHLPILNFDLKPINNPIRLSSFIKNYILNKDIKNRIIYVGGLWHNNFSSIQHAINEAKPGDIVYVYEGIYYENLYINKSIYLFGENKYNTIINGKGYGDIIIFNADNISIKGFTIQNGHYGIFSENTSNHKILDNNINDNLQGVSFINCTNIILENNDFIDNQYGIRLFFSNNIEIHYNNFKSYKLNIYFIESNGLFENGNWDFNYWGEACYFPYIIFGKKIFGDESRFWFRFDWFPLKIPNFFD
jgi:parallel beta-helix repeat protein